MNQTAVGSIKVDPKLQKKAQKVAEGLGFSLSAVLTGFIKKFIREQGMNFSLEEEYSDYFIKSMKESEEDVKAGRVISFKNEEDAIAYLDKMIADDEQKIQKNRLR